MKRTAPKTTDDYLATVPQPHRATLQKVRRMIHAAAPKATEAISYQMPAFRQGAMLVCYAAFKNHCSFFVGRRITQAHMKLLRGYETMPGGFRFPADKPPPAKLIRSLVRMRLDDIAEKAARKR